jgi:Transposase DDE domain
MERQLLWILYQRLGTLRRETPSKCGHHDRWVVLTYVWSVLSDRPVSWACRPENWPARFAGYSPPSPATMSRRLRTKSVRQLLVRLLRSLQRNWPQARVWFIDGKPLPVGGSSGDREARAGRGAGLMAKGYKLHAIVQATGRLEALTVLPMHVNETRVAQTLIGESLRRIDGGGYLVGDTAYDAMALYDLAAAKGIQLVARPRKAYKGLGHKHQSPLRLLGLGIAYSAEGHALLRSRFAIDRMFGTWGNTAGGLGPLPNWVRHLHRVRLWVLAKIVILAGIKNEKQALAA